MFVDFRSLDTSHDISADVCIIGAGAAGIAIARSFINTGMEVCLLESGGFEPDTDIQSLYTGDSIGFEQTGPVTCRLRYFGGTTNHWAGHCAPLREIDYQYRPWIPYSGWPIGPKDLLPYYEGAQEVCQLGPYQYDMDAYRDGERKYPPVLESKLTLRFWQYSPPTRFGKVYRKELESSHNVKVYLFANVVELEANSTATALQRLKIQTLEGKTGYARAKYFVLACGGIENTRMLLLSDKVEPNGLGNGSKLVGRFFQQHLEYHELTRVLANDPNAFAHTFNRFQKNNYVARAEMNVSDHAQARHEILNCAFTADNVWGSGYHDLRNMWHEIREGSWPDDTAAKLWEIMKDFDSVLEGVYTRARGDNYLGNAISIPLHVRCEQWPNPDSRIYLGPKTDRLGLRQVVIDWRITEFEKRTIRTSLQLVGEELGRLGIGRVNIPQFLLDENNEWPQPIWNGCHHMGTTRMSDNPQQGVVDRNCRMHSVHNLYIASSSVFPVSGYVTPTLTIVALALRIADHIKGKLS